MSRTRYLWLRLITSDLAFRVVLLIVLALGITAVVLSFRTAGDARSGAIAAQATKESSERADCRSEQNTPAVQLDRKIASGTALALAALAVDDQALFARLTEQIRVDALQLAAIPPLPVLVEANCPEVTTTGASIP